MLRTTQKQANKWVAPCVAQVDDAVRSNLDAMLQQRRLRARAESAEAEVATLGAANAALGVDFANAEIERRALRNTVETLRLAAADERKTAAAKDVAMQDMQVSALSR